MGFSTESDPEDRAVPGEAQPRAGAGLIVLQDFGADSGLRRRLSSRHISMIALGSSIGMGLWLGSGTSLADGGPAAIFIGYILAGSMIWAVSHSIGEMAVLYPLPSAFVQWSNKFVDPAMGFALGWCYWFSYWILIANELQGVATVLRFWTAAVPTAAWIAAFWAAIVAVNVAGVSVFGEVEVVATAVKFGWIFVVIVSCVAVSAGGGPGGGATGFRYWAAEPFTHGFKGFLAVMPTCIFAMAGSENAGLVACETGNPRRAVPRAVSSIWIRLALFYILGSLMITITVSPHEEDLFGGAGTNASPFVIAYRNAGLSSMAHITNAIIFISVLSAGSISGYSGSRTLFGLAQINMAPGFMTRADSQGRPWYALIPSLLIGGALAFLNVSENGATVFGWFSKLVSLFTLFGWAMICLSHIRMRYAWRIQGRSVDELPWKTWTWPWGAAWGLFSCLLCIVVQFYLAVWPLVESPSVLGFLANYVSVVAFIVVWLGAKLYYGGRFWVDCSTIDLDAGRRFYADREDKDEKKPNKLMAWIRHV